MSMEDRSISVELAGRAYPLTIQQAEETYVRRAADEINESIDRLKAGYPLTDKQDLLAMAALEVTTRVLNQAAPRAHADDIAALEALEEVLSAVPERSPS